DLRTPACSSGPHVAMSRTVALGAGGECLSIRGTGHVAGSFTPGRHPTSGGGNLARHLLAGKLIGRSGGVVQQQQQLHRSEEKINGNGVSGNNTSLGTEGSTGTDTTLARGAQTLLTGQQQPGSGPAFGPRARSRPGSRPRSGSGLRAGSESASAERERDGSLLARDRDRDRDRDREDSLATGESMRSSKAESDRSGEMVTIHVCDESRSITQDFSCEKKLLLREMEYFRSYLVEAPSPYDEIDILVHCDVRIFEWLFRYMHGDGRDANNMRESN
ncbi:unnamed protein product, partial [Discosporangium mesarthrocarpum]